MNDVRTNDAQYMHILYPLGILLCASVVHRLCIRFGAEPEDNTLRVYPWGTLMRVLDLCVDCA